MSRTDEKLVEMTNGCICCTLRDDLLQEVARLARERSFDYLLIESSGISEPLPVAMTFSFDAGDGHPMVDIARLDTMVTVIDAYNFMRDYGSAQFLRNLNMEDGEGDQRTIVDLLTEQVEFANVIVLNKIDLIDAFDRERLADIVCHLNPDGKLIYSEHSLCRWKKF